jgi:hypothetical protein
MKNNRLKYTHDKKKLIFKPEDCLNYIKPNQRIILRDPFLFKGPPLVAKDNDHDFRERYRI